MRRQGGILLGALVTTVAMAEDCRTSHFNVVHEAARAALHAERGMPRMGYMPPDMQGEDVYWGCYHTAKAIAGAAGEPDQFAVASDDGKRSIEMLRCIAKENGDLKLPLLEFVFVGGPEDEDEARRIVEAWGAKFLFVADPLTQPSLANAAEDATPGASCAAAT
jgi:hypothetical protein